MKIVCKKCGFTSEDQSKLELHHVIPKCIGGVDLDGRVWLCKKCHDILGGMLLKQVWNFVPENKQINCHDKIKGFTDWWVNK